MKRAMIITLLLLMIATSLSAGTLAVYTSTVDLAVLAVSAKRFALGVNQGSQSEFDLKIAPGEMVSYYFDVSNTNEEDRVAEVDMDLLIQGDFSAVYASFPDIAIQLMLHSSSGYNVVAEANASGMLTYNKSAMFEAENPQTKHFILSFQWGDSEAARELINANRIVLPLTLYVRGTQHLK